jgi:RHS repeat-associated protein
MTDPHGNEPVEFDDATADALASALTTTASSIESQSGSRFSFSSTALLEFRGHFAELFDQNRVTAATGARDLVSTMRTVSQWVRTMQAAAKRENDRRRRAREFDERQADRNLVERWHDDWFGGEQAPTEQAEPKPTFPQPDVAVGSRQTPNPGGGGGGGGTSSAKPEDLRSFATGSSQLDADLSGKPGALRGKFSDFAAKCHWGTISSSGLVSGFEKWLSDNAQDVTWANTVADAFAAAGGEGSVSTVSDAALGAALQAAGVSATRSALAFDPPSAYGAQPTTGFSMDPVNTTTGNFVEPETDLAFLPASAALAITRMYNSLDRSVGLFGPGWASVLETRLLLDDEGASLVEADGRQIRFPRRGAGWDRGVGENRWLAAEGDLLVVRDNAGVRIDFTPAGVWVGQSAGPGTAVRVDRDGDDLPVRLRHERGRSVDVEYVDGRVAVLRASDGRRVEYGYDDQDRLVSVTTAAGTRRYSWDEDDLVVTVTSAAGVVEADNTYDAERRVVEQRSPHGRRVRFAYLPGRVTAISDEDGSRSNAWIADPKGRLIGVIDSDDQRQSMSYDPHGNLVSSTARDGSVAVHGYDARGRRIRTVTPAGADVTTGYDEHDRVTTVVSESGAVTTFEYRGDDRDPAVITDPLGGRTELTWHDGLLVRAVDQTGVVFSQQHDAHGELVAVTNAVGDTVRIERDTVGRVTAVVSATGARTEYRYDAAGNAVARQDADGAVWRSEYDHAGRVTAQVDPTGARTTITYGADGEVATVADALGRVTSQTHDDQGNTASVTLPDGASWGFVHDALSRLREVTDPTGARWLREYAVDGALTATVDPTGVRQESSTDPTTGMRTLRDAFSSSSVRFDEFGRPVERTSDTTGAELVTYDAAGNPVELVDGEGGLTRLERDLAGRVVALTLPSGARTTYEYDACGRPAAAVDPLGARTTLTYDADSRVVARTLPTGEVERTEYDAVGRVLTWTTPGSGTTRYRWDTAGRLASVQDARFGRRRFRYDAAGQVTEVVDGLGGVTRYEYDVRGRVVTVTDPTGAVTRRAYDAADRLVAETDPLGRTSTIEHDAAGRPVRQVDRAGRVVVWSYDAAGRKQRLEVDGTLQGEVSHDLVGRRVVVTDHTRGPGRTLDHELRYDRRGLLVRRSRGDRAVAWEYDADGLRAARTDPDGTRTRLRRDAAGRLVAVERDGRTAGTFAYDASGRVVESASGELVQHWTYRGGALVAHTATTTEGVSRTTVERDADDRIAAVTGGGGRVTYRHDDAGQLVSALDDDGRGRTWTYDAGGRLVAETLDGVETRHEYDVAGALLASTTDGDRTEYVADGLGRRIRRTAPDGSTTEYAWSPLGYLGGVVERDVAYRETGRIDLWVDVLGELADAAGAETWWDTAAVVPTLVSVAGTSLFELPGGVTLVGDAADAAGWRGARATDPHDPWAVLAAATGLQSGLGLPTGVALSATGGLDVGGLEWLGARVYDPVARGFLSADPLAPVVGAGWAGNPYSYAGNDPLHAIDPLGLRPATDKDLKAYNDAHVGNFAAAGNWIADHKEAILATAMIVGGVALMFVPGGALVTMAMAASSGALLAGGFSIVKQGPDSGNVDWGEVGRQTLIGFGTGLLGGGAASGLKAAAGASTVVNSAGTGVMSTVGRGVMSQTGRAATAASIEGGASNGADYLTDPSLEGKRNVSDFLQTTGAGVVSGATGSVASSGLQKATDLTNLFPAGTGRHAAPVSGDHGSQSLPFTIANEVVGFGADGVAGAGASVLNEGLKPGGDTGEDLRPDAWNGFFGGGEGPLPIGSHAH